MIIVATVPTVYGIETFTNFKIFEYFIAIVATAPTVYGIETRDKICCHYRMIRVATVPTVYGIETGKIQ